MSRLDWFVLGGALLFVVLWGLYKGRGATTGEGYIGGGRDHRWWLIGLSIIAKIGRASCRERVSIDV